jgi:hypothetical protein
VITYSWEILHTASTYKHDAVLLKVVALSRDVGVDLFGVGETYTGNLTHGRIRLLRRSGVHADAHAPLLRARIQCTRLA